MPRIGEVRHLLLGLIPRQPNRIATPDLARMLEASGIKVTPRAVQKMCAKLAEQEPDIVCDDSSKPFQWFWRKDARTREYPPMNAHAALTLKMAFEQAKHLLPAATLEHLKHQQRRAEAVLEESATMRSWRRKVRVLPRGLGQLPPAIDREVLRTVYDALLADLRLQVHYRSWNRSEEQALDLFPLALVARDSKLTLVCTVRGRDGIRQLHLHRMRDAKAVRGVREIPPGFDIDAHIREGHLNFLKSEAPIELRLRLHPDVVQTVTETPVAPGQRLVAE
ncbi:MAG: WYL domain-containing protein, partial [Deltaproteobacteria bacterium]|nr:WYL domain-containing protein [Deltaproteobacteria bacterium]